MNNDLKNVSYIDQDVLFFPFENLYFFHSFHLYFKKKYYCIITYIIRQFFFTFSDKSPAYCARGGGHLHNR